MTAIVGFVDKEQGRVWIGGDSAGTADDIRSIRTDPKVFFRGEMLIGFAGSFRMGQILAHHLDPPGHPKGASGFDYMVATFIPCVMKLMDDHRYGGTDEEGSAQGGQFIVGYRGSMYLIDTDYQVGTVYHPYATIASGGEICLGAMHALHDYEFPPRERLRMALKASAEFCTTVSAPFLILATDPIK